MYKFKKASVPDVGVQPEAPSVLQAQVDLIGKGPRKAAMTYGAFPNEVTLPKGIKTVRLKINNEPVSFAYDPKLVSPHQLNMAIAGDKLGTVLGMGVETKADADKVMLAQTPEGKTVNAVAVNETTLPKAQEAAAQQGLSTGPVVEPDQALADRKDQVDRELYGIRRAKAQRGGGYEDVVDTADPVSPSKPTTDISKEPAYTVPKGITEKDFEILIGQVESGEIKTAAIKRAYGYPIHRAVLSAIKQRASEPSELTGIAPKEFPKFMRDSFRDESIRPKKAAKAEAPKPAEEPPVVEPPKEAASTEVIAPATVDVNPDQYGRKPVTRPADARFIDKTGKFLDSAGKSHPEVYTGEYSTPTMENKMLELGDVRTSATKEAVAELFYADAPPSAVRSSIKKYYEDVLKKYPHIKTVSISMRRSPGFKESGSFEYEELKTDADRASAPEKMVKAIDEFYAKKKDLEPTIESKEKEDPEASANEADARRAQLNSRSQYERWQDAEYDIAPGTYKRNRKKFEDMSEDERKAKLSDRILKLPVGTYQTEEKESNSPSIKRIMVAEFGPMAAGMDYKKIVRGLQSLNEKKINGSFTLGLDEVHVK